jgi:hypothetical protein
MPQCTSTYPRPAFQHQQQESPTASAPGGWQLCCVQERGIAAGQRARANGNNRAPHTVVWRLPHSVIRSSAQGRKQGKPNKSLTARAGALARGLVHAPLPLTGQQTRQRDVGPHAHIMHAGKIDIVFSHIRHQVCQPMPLQHAQPHQTAWLARKV